MGPSRVRSLLSKQRFENGFAWVVYLRALVCELNGLDDPFVVIWRMDESVDDEQFDLFGEAGVNPAQVEHGFALHLHVQRDEHALREPIALLHALVETLTQRVKGCCKKLCQTFPAVTVLAIAH